METIFAIRCHGSNGVLAPNPNAMLSCPIAMPSIYRTEEDGVFKDV